ncbi:hypothetical protein AC477_01365 [miscellaneous Crenarchaeota group-1 archaeon SG8-32-1]|uniref:Uncharacterized protein n=1 Tax=miscellaneous Crenarchaeota group-1 archaeon SG8-32-1 TaxID=1685124 RepID=A0A0M0BZ48_9ARCH|nr:MAG: hypothetical protein AC477_01365 [miscellaneous Crenarchaeota group-1 archaeon SG8-32-1]
MKLPRVYYSYFHPRARVYKINYSILFIKLTIELEESITFLFVGFWVLELKFNQKKIHACKWLELRFVNALVI